MRKIISVLLLVLSLFVVAGCSVDKKDDKNDDDKEVVRTYKADGTYMVWKLSTTNATLYRADKVTPVKDDAGKDVKVASPVISTVKVTIVNDKVVKYEIDELQSKAYVSTARAGGENFDVENNAVKGVTWEFNAMTKRQLEYGYNMEPAAQTKQGEWYQQILKLENYWLEKGPVSDDIIKTSVTITFDDKNSTDYVSMALEALENAKKGKIGAITDKEHYTYDVTFVNADVDANGKISNVKLNAWLFGNVKENTYVKGHADYLKFGWNEQDKYASYAAMSNSKKWQDQIDAVNAYINENGWDASVTAGVKTDGTYKDKGLSTNGVAIEAMSSVTIQLSREVLVMNMLYEFFPRGWK